MLPLNTFWLNGKLGRLSANCQIAQLLVSRISASGEYKTNKNYSLPASRKSTDVVCVIIDP
jgi:hypothetical protein